MGTMTDPSVAMMSFQEELLAGRLSLERGRLDNDLHFMADAVPGVPRFTYVRLEGNRVIAFATFVMTEPYKGSPCMQLGYAVPEEERGRGLATDLVGAAIAELRNGFAGHPPFAVEAVVGVENFASQKVASRTLTEQRREIIDGVSGKPAYQYIQKFKTGRP